MKTLKLLLILGAASITSWATAVEPSAKAKKIAAAARAAFLRAPQVALTGELFGRRIRTEYSPYGQVSCGYVVSAILARAAVGIDIPEDCALRVKSHAGYCGVEDFLRGGKVIARQDQLLEGDVVLWLADASGFAGSLCMGKAKNHVGIYVGAGFAVDAYSLNLGAPDMRSVDRPCWKFSRAYRF